MSTRRERLGRKLEKREEWAESRRAKSDADASQASDMAKAIPLGQPMMPGHHSYKRDRNYRERIGRKFERAHEHDKMAKHHDSKADGLRRQLDNSIYSDDPDAIEQLEAKLAELETSREYKKLVNAAWRKFSKLDQESPSFLEKAEKILSDKRLRKYGDLELMRALDAKLKSPETYSWCKQPFPSYELQNLGGNITRTKKRIEEVRRRQERQARAEASGGLEIRHGANDTCQVTFAEKPDLEILDALKAAGFHWSGGSWLGYSSKLPSSVSDSA